MTDYLCDGCGRVFFEEDYGPLDSCPNADCESHTSGLTKWYCLNAQGDIQYVGEFETFEEADKSLEYGCGCVWLVDEECAREWLAQLKELLED